MDIEDYKPEFEFGYPDKVKAALDILRMFEPPEGYYLAFSGGKDSQCIIELAKMAGVKFDAHFHLTGVDPPEVCQFVRREYPEVKIKVPHSGMFKLIVKEKWPPTKIARYCCEELKENGGNGRVVLTGVRKEESVRRSKRKMVESCLRKNTNKSFVHPILEWTTEEVWEFLKQQGRNHCSLYDRGFTRIGCLLCPQSRRESREFEEKQYPGIVRLYKKAFAEMIEERNKAGMKSLFSKDLDGLWEWWMGRLNIQQDVEEGSDGYIPRFF
jgi:phosphoadenosine phosphosulfate reductase